jgi:hypothetical protein
MRRTSKLILRSLMVSIVLSGVTAAMAEDKPQPPATAEPSKETREKMAVMHEKMAACLRSDKSIADCRNEMRAYCQQTPGGCPVGPGMGMHGPMNRPDGTTPTK